MSSYQETDYKSLYKTMKRKLKILIYENECFQEELKKAQKSLLKVQRDKTFLLDRILQYQQGPESSSDSEQTDDSDNENYNKDNKRKKVSMDQNSSFSVNSQGNNKSSSVKKKRPSQNVLGSGVVLSKNVNASRHGHGGKQVPSSASNNAQTSPYSKGSSSSSAPHKSKASLQAGLASSNSGAAVCASSATSTATSDGQMTREEIERQLAARQPISDFSTAVSLTLPNQLFSEGDLMDNDLETSPSNLGEDITFENFD